MAPFNYRKSIILLKIKLKLIYYISIDHIVIYISNDILLKINLEWINYTNRLHSYFIKFSTVVSQGGEIKLFNTLSNLIPFGAILE